ncbi:MAG: DUF3352 domain-containing protein [bacterium]|nr:DUF3352 domain-containing protein [bacterium]
MRKRGFVIGLCCIIFTLLPLAHAQDQMAGGIARMAAYFPQDTFLFAAARIDDAYLQEIDALAERILGDFQQFGVPSFSLEQALMLVTGDARESLAWLGDAAAIGAVGDPRQVFDPQPGGDTYQAYAVIAIDDPAAAAAYLETRLLAAGYERRADDGAFVRPDNLVVTVQGDVLIVYADGSPAPTLENASGLESSPSFTAALAELPAEGYNLLAYGDLEVQDFGRALSPGVDRVIPEVPPFMIGATILQGDTLALDLVHLTAFESVGTIDPAFARFIPADANVVVHATNLTTTIRETLYRYFDLILFGVRPPGAAFEGGGTESALSQALASAGIDLDEDILRWTTGDYALFMRVDTVGIARTVVQNRVDLNAALDFGFVTEATDPEAAAAFADALVELLTEAGRASESALRVTPYTVGGVDAALFELTVELAQGAEPYTLALVIGTTDAVFFVTTLGAAESLFTSDASLLNAAAYQDAANVILPNPASVWYTDGEGFIVGAVANPIGLPAGLALLGPSVGNVFSSIVTNLDGTGAPPTATPTPSPTPTLTAPQIDQQVAPLETLNNLIRHSTMSSTITGSGATVLRMTITLNPES